MKALDGRQVVLYDSELLRREAANRKYLLKLDSDNLLLNFRLEAGRPTENYGALPEKTHGGWENPICQLRGHFLGHWLSAAAIAYHETGNTELKGKAEMIIEELEQCQLDNGGEWAASIPEKYFTWIAKGKNVWAPHYTVHKTFMGLLDMYRYAGCEKALEIAERFADWFDRYSAQYTREEFDNILDYETGGMLEIWAIMLELTGKEKYRTLMERYYRGRLFDRLLAGEDPLTNMHANTTIPEIIGCAKAYEVTGEQRYRDIVEAYWKCAVTDRGTYVTGGQTCGEIWTPKGRTTARLGDRNQEHCTVYNMIRLADFMFRWTGEPVYADYIEKNFYNGLMAQAYWQSNAAHGIDDGLPKKGLLTYFLPMRAGSRKGWGSETDDFFCCHGTVVQANAAWNTKLFYQNKETVYVCQYFNSKAEFEVNGKKVTVTQMEDTLSGSFHLSSTSPARQSISSVTSTYADHPDCRMQYLAVNCEGEVPMKLALRIPEWACEEVELTLNGEALEQKGAPGTFFMLERTWKNDDTVGLCLKKTVKAVPLMGEEDRVAFTYGPITLAGLVDEEVTIHSEDPASALAHETEREWGSWKDSFRLKGQEHGVRFVPLMDIGYEKYTVYFPVKKD